MNWRGRMVSGMPGNWREEFRKMYPGQLEDDTGGIPDYKVQRKLPVEEWEE